jgi:hypothetical protein
MTDVATQEQSVADPEGTNAPAEAQAEKTPKPAPAKHACACQFYEVYKPGDEDQVFTTGCTQDTGSVFAQGHDARLVSFLVDGKADGYEIRHVKDGVSTSYATPAESVADISNALQGKAEKAWENRQARLSGAAERKAARDALKAKKAADREAAKQAKAAAAEAKKAEAKSTPKAVGVEVVAGSSEGDQTELQPGQAIIKVGKFEYLADVDADGNAAYTDGSGAEQARERDGYQLLRAYEAPAV